MTGKTYGYVRVSSREQNEARQLAAMREFGVESCCVVVEKCSGATFDRPLYQKLLRRLRAGDALVIQSIDRLGRNYSEILEQWRMITKERGAAIVVLDMPLLDTRRGRDLTGVVIADIVLQLLSYVAQTEREFIRRRQAEGIAAAKERGVHFGPPRMDMPSGFEKLAHRWQAGELSARQASRELSVSYQTFLRRAKEWGGQTVER